MEKGVLRTRWGTVGHPVASLPEQEPHPCLVIYGAEDSVISDVPGPIRAASRMPIFRQLVFPNCHAPQIEKYRQGNPLVARFLDDKLKTLPRSLDPARFLLPHNRLIFGAYLEVKHLPAGVSAQSPLPPYP